MGCIISSLDVKAELWQFWEAWDYERLPEHDYWNWLLKEDNLANLEFVDTISPSFPSNLSQNTRLQGLDVMKFENSA